MCRRLLKKTNDIRADWPDETKLGRLTPAGALFPTSRKQGPMV
jgi:hypothetical protein